VSNWLFSNIATEKNEKLPNLKQIMIRNGSEGEPEEIPQEGPAGSDQIQEDVAQGADQNGENEEPEAGAGQESGDKPEEPRT
jgi:hypothetical protein